MGKLDTRLKTRCVTLFLSFVIMTSVSTPIPYEGLQQHHTNFALRTPNYHVDDIFVMPSIMDQANLTSQGNGMASKDTNTTYFDDDADDVQLLDDSHFVISPEKQRPENGDAVLENAKEIVSKLFWLLREDDRSLTKYLFDDITYEDNSPFMSNREAQSFYQNKIPWWELTEMHKYQSIWFVGEGTNKTQFKPEEEMNFGFDEIEDKDDDERMLKIVIGDHLAYRYEVVKKLGTGSYGRVVMARDHGHANKLVAIKIMHNGSDSLSYFKQECDMMELVTTLTDYSMRYSHILGRFFFRNHFCIVYELLGPSMFKALQAPVTNMSVMRKYAWDILIAIRNLHNINVVHGDLKPENILTVPGCDILCPTYMTITDFNLACIPKSTQFPCSGTHFQTRHYRAPEVIMDLDYGTAADMWSVGVILSEFFLGEVPFYGETSTDQLAAVMEVMGLVPAWMVQISPRIRTYQKAVCYTCKNGFKRQPYRKPLNQVLQDASPLFYDFIHKCFQLDPTKRMTAQEALDHPFMKFN